MKQQRDLITIERNLGDGIKIMVQTTFGEPVVMTLHEWFAINLPRDDQEDQRIAIRFAMDAQFEIPQDWDGPTAVLSRIA